MATNAVQLGGVADQLFDAIERGDKAGVADLWAADVTVWHAGDTRDNERARALRVIDWFIDATVDRRYEMLDRQFFDGGFVQQHLLHASGHHGALISLRVCIVIKVGDDGLITRVDEYFDPHGIEPLTTTPGEETP